MENLRKTRFYFNISTGIVQKIIYLVTGFIIRTVFIYTLGLVYLGVNGLFTDIQTVFSLAELGIGGMMTYYLYQPLARKDTERIKSVMQFYKVCYRVIGAVILIIGLLYLPFVSYLINVDTALDVNINIIYLLYLTDTVTSYLFFAYKGTLLSAAQQAYKAQIIESIWSIVSTLVLSIILLKYHNFLLYFAGKISCNILRNIIISEEINRVFPILKERGSQKLSKEDLREIAHGVYGLFVERVSGTIYSSTDSMIISKIIGTIVVGINDNYKMITRSVAAIGGIFIGALNPLAGDVAAKCSPQECAEHFYKFNFFNFWCFGIATVCLAQLLNPFISLWIGPGKTFEQPVVMILVLNFWMDNILMVVYSFRLAYGLYRYGKYYRLLGAVINVILSICWAKTMGVFGVMLATSITNLVVFFYPYYLFKYGFKMKPYKYYRDLAGQIIITGISYVIAHWACGLVKINGFFGLFAQAFICVTVVIVVFGIRYWHTEEFQFMKNEICRYAKVCFEKYKR